MIPKERMKFRVTIICKKCGKVLRSVKDVSIVDIRKEIEYSIVGHEHEPDLSYEIERE